MTKLYIFPIQRGIDELEACLKVSKIIDRRTLRSKVNIAVIDDEPFPAGKNLTHHGFQLKEFNDIADIYTLTDFPIILCDLQGVGSNFDPVGQGAQLITEMKRNWPEKYVIAYSGGSSNATLSKTANKHADAYIKKDADINDWQASLDSAIDEVTDPVKVWKKFRLRALTEYNVSLKDLMQLENTFVRLCFGAARNADPDAYIRQACTKYSLPAANGFREEFASSFLLKFAVKAACLYLEANNAS